jgi:hypothetical protein
MHTIKVNWSNGDSTVTEINGTKESVESYYVGKKFNVGIFGADLIATALSVEFLEA